MQLGFRIARLMAAWALGFSASIPAMVDAQFSLQTRLAPLDGADGDSFAESVAADAGTVVIGATGDDDRGTDSGSVYVFVRSAPSWALQQKLVPADGAAHDSFGTSVAISGNTAVIGVPGDDDVASGVGSAYVFVRSGTIWSLQQKLLPASSPTLTAFGSSLAISGDTVIVGAPQDNTPLVATAGAAYVFVRSGTIWSQQQKLFADIRSTGDNFGSAVALSGNGAVVGAPDAGDDDIGAAYAFVRSGTTWSQQQELVIPDGFGFERFGGSVATNGNTALVGAIEAAPAGAAYAFLRNGSSWSLQQKLLPADGQSFDWFGFSVALQGELAVVGAPFHIHQGESSGSAYVFERNGTSWTQRAELLAVDGGDAVDFGGSVALSDGVAIIGAHQSFGATADTGAAYSFENAPVAVPATTGSGALGLGLLLLMAGATATRWSPPHAARRWRSTSRQRRPLSIEQD